jgi:hypothetical protein
MARTLTQPEIEDLLARNFALAGWVTAHEVLFSTPGSWDQVRFGSPDFANLPIPPAGRIVRDDKYGNVLIFPDASGKLHYTADVSDQIATQVNLPPYYSPPNYLRGIEDAFGALFKTFGVAIVGGVIVYAITRGVLDD